MSITARIIPWSSVVGTGVTLHDDTGKVIGQLALHNVAKPEIANIKDWHGVLIQQVADAINAPKNGPIGVNNED